LDIITPHTYTGRLYFVSFPDLWKTDIAPRTYTGRLW